MAHEYVNQAVPVLAPSRPFRFHYPYTQSIAISFFQSLDPPDIDIKIFREDIMKLEIPNSTVQRVISRAFGGSNMMVYFKDAGTYEDNPFESLSVVMLRRPHTDVISWFCCSHSLNGLLFHLEQKALISVPAYIRPEENPPHVNDHAIPNYLSWNHTDLHTRLCLLLRHCFPPRLLLGTEPEDDQEDDNVSLRDEPNDVRDVELADEQQAPAENDKAVAPDEINLQSETDSFGDEDDNGEQLEMGEYQALAENDKAATPGLNNPANDLLGAIVSHGGGVEITDDNQAPAGNDEAAAPQEFDSGDDATGAATATLNPAIPPDYAARLAPLRPATVRDYTRLQDDLRDTVGPGEQMLAGFNHCKSLVDYQRDKQAFLTAAQGEKKTMDEWRVWAVQGHGFGGRNCRDIRARQWAKTFHAIGWVELKEE